MPPNAAQLICRQCGVPQEIAAFRRRRAGVDMRIRQCHACHAQSERLRRRAKRSKGHRQAVNRELTRLKRAKSAKQLQAVCEALINAFGGLEGFTAAWRACLEADLVRGGFAAIRHLEAVLRLVQHVEALPRPVSNLSDEELLRLADAMPHV